MSFYIIAAIFFCQGCGNKSNTIIRQNFSNGVNNNFKENDTNRVNIWLYKSLLNHVSKEDSLLLYERYGHLWHEYGLYNCKTKEYLFTTMENGYKFKNDTTIESRLLHTKLKEYIGKSEQELFEKTRTATRSELMHGTYTSMSIIKIKSKNEAFVKSFYF